MNISYKGKEEGSKKQEAGTKSHDSRVTIQDMIHSILRVIRGLFQEPLCELSGK
jgi:hypothetical protein